MKEPSWIVEGRKYIGEKEIKGPEHNPLILQFWKDIKRGGIKDDETPWCAAYVGECWNVQVSHQAALNQPHLILIGGEAG